VDTLRYPGGGYADIFHWPVTRNAAGFANGFGSSTPRWGTTNDYGYIGGKTDFGSFIGLLTNAQAQAVITVDYGSGLLWGTAHTNLIIPGTNGQPQEAAAWVAYANASTNIYGTVNDVTLGVDALGNDWKSAGYWAMMRAAKPLGTDDGYNFLRLNRATPIGIKYWEIGNETFGNGYYDSSGDGYSIDYAVPYDGTERSRNPNLSPAFYGQRVKLYSQAMKAVDLTVQIGAVVSTPPGDYSWDDYDGQRWTPEVLAQCATNIDFVIAHWYPYAGENDDGSTLLPQVAGTIPFMINGATPGQDSGTNSGLRDWINAYRPTDGTNVQIFITEFGYTGSLTNLAGGYPVQGPADALFAADCYASWINLGVANIDYLEMNSSNFLGDVYGGLARGAVYYAVQMLRHVAGPGDRLLAATSDTNTLRADAAWQHDGKLGLLLINENRTNSQTVNVTVANVSLNDSGVVFQFGVGNFPFTGRTWIPSSGPSSNNVDRLGNSFSIIVPAYTMVGLVIPIISNTPPVLAPIGNQTVNVGQTVAFTASATDTNQPPQTLTFTLLAAPTNATLTTAGAFSWRPLVSQAATTNAITLAVTDSSVPPLSATQSFVITVNPLTPSAMSLPAASWSSGQFTLRVSGEAGPDYEIQTSTNLVQWSTLFATNSPAMPFVWTDANAGAMPVRFYRTAAGPPLP
jgi:hypothetical protein